MALIDILIVWFVFIFSTAYVGWCEKLYDGWNSSQLVANVGTLGCLLPESLVKNILFIVEK